MDLSKLITKGGDQTYIGIDVDKSFLTIAEVNEKGEPIGESKIKNCFQAMDTFGREHDMCKIAIEASSYSIPVYRRLVIVKYQTFLNNDTISSYGTTYNY